MVTPSYMLTLLDEFERQGVDPRTHLPRVGIFGAEPWTEEMRREIEERIDIHAVDIYGLSEVVGPGVAQECVETKDGLHVWEDHFYPEIVDPITGELLPDGERGAGLHLPDQGGLADHPLPHQRPDPAAARHGPARFRRIEKITGRSDDMIILRGVNLFPSQIEEIVLRTPGVAPHFQIELSRRGRLDHMNVRVEARADASADRQEAAARTIAKGVKDGVGVSVEVTIVEPETLERSARRAAPGQRPSRSVIPLATVITRCPGDSDTARRLTRILREGAGPKTGSASTGHPRHRLRRPGIRVPGPASGREP